MINNDDYNSYKNRHDAERGIHRCFLCKNLIEPQKDHTGSKTVDMYDITKKVKWYSKYVSDRFETLREQSVSNRKSLFFHSECFEQIAGHEFMFEE